MANGNGGLVNKVLMILSSLVVSGVIGGIVMYQNVGVAQSNIERLDREQQIQREEIRKGFDKINEKLDQIVDAISDHKEEGARYHHKHEPPR